MAAAGDGARLLQWLDAGNGPPVMARVAAALAGAAASSSTGPPLVVLEVDATALACDDPALAVAVMQHTREVAGQAAALMCQQLAMQAPAQAAAGPDADEPSPTVRACIKLTAVPLPLATPCEARKQLLQSSGSLSNSNSDAAGSIAPAPAAAPVRLVSLLGVVSGLSPPAQHTHSQRFDCPACHSVVDVLAADERLPCCGLAKPPALQEDLTGRVMVPAQQAWVADLSSALGQQQYGVSAQSLLVALPEHAVGSCCLGIVVHVVGHARILLPGGAGAARAPGGCCSVQLLANSITPLAPQLLWSLAPPCFAQLPLQELHAPLQLLYDLFSAALGHQAAPLDPYLSLGLLVSAAAVSNPATLPVGTPQQVSLLALHEQGCPGTLRLLREAAALLSAQSVAMPVQQAEHVTPISAPASDTEDAGAAGKAVFASVLHLANAGVAVADLSSMPPRQRQVLLQALQLRSTPRPRDAPPELALPLTATAWAAGSWQDMCPTAGCDAFGRVPKRKGAASPAAAAAALAGFDLVLADCTVHEEHLLASLGSTAAAAAGSCIGAEQRQQQAAMACVRHLMAGAAATCNAGAGAMQLTDAAQAFLGNYFMLVRQSLDSSSKVSKPLLLGSLVRLASAVARLHQRPQVLDCPDATLAVLLMEQSLANKLGESYSSLLDLPCELTLPSAQAGNNSTCSSSTSSSSLDEQLVLLHGSIARIFVQHACDGDGQECGTGAASGDAGGCCSDEDSGCSGGGGGAAGPAGGFARLHGD